MPVPEETIRERVADLTVWKRGGERAPHKPLLLLYALGRCRRGEQRLVSYEEAHGKLNELLEEFGPPRKTHHPEYPFWRLENDGLWELAGPEADRVRERDTDPSSRYLAEHDIRGGFPPDIQATLASDPELIGELARDLLEDNFPRSIHEDVLAAIGLELKARTAARRSRDPNFRDIVLRAYEYRCGVCSFDVRIGNTLVALEAAHIKWHQAGGPDTGENGIALCSLHHKLFDRGAFTVSPDHRVVVSEQVNGSVGLQEWLLEHHEEPLAGPQSPDYQPEEKFLEWHDREVFRGPARA
jgi:putative restriction endonuclease